VGMFGTSYAGFATLHVGMRPPPALKAIVPIYATDDRYTDDIHFAGGVRKAIEFGYPLYMVSMNALPPVPALAGEGWREQWLRRIDELLPWFGSIEQQSDGPFWRQGSVRPDYDLIRVPTMIVGGWSDLYRSAAFRLFEHLEVPKRLLMGPWSHMEPNSSIPGPRIDHIHELIRWFDRWLRDADNGIDREPPIVLFARKTTRPEPDLDAYEGEWRFEPAWPPEQPNRQPEAWLPHWRHPSQRRPRWRRSLRRRRRRQQQWRRNQRRKPRTEPHRQPERRRRCWRIPASRRQPEPAPQRER